VGCGVPRDLAAGGLKVRNRLRELRSERGWSQGVLADRLDVSRQTVNALETGRYDPSLPLAFRIAALFDATIEAIFLPDGAAADHTGTPLPTPRHSA
jgi:putative transcriptional regulator